MTANGTCTPGVNQVRVRVKKALLPCLLALAAAACRGHPIPLVSTPVPSPTAVRALPDSFKGYEVYSWPVNGGWQFTLITGTNRTKTLEEILSGENVVTEDGWVRISVHGVEAIKAMLSALPPGEDILWLGEPHLGQQQSQPEPFALPPQDIVAVLQEHCSQLDLRLHVSS